MKLGQIEGVVRTEAGYFKGREVTLVEYAPERLALEELAQRSPGGVPDGSPLDGSYRTAPADDQKKQIAGTPFAHLQLSAAQATKVNAFAREDPAKALEWLSPAQRKQVKSAK